MQNDSRRDWISRMAVMLGAGAFATTLEAQNAPVTDLTILNFALTLENLEATFYNQGLKQFSSTDFSNGAFYQGLGDAMGGDVYAFLSLVRDHENQHVRTLRGVIKSLGGTPAPVCTYNFGYQSVDDFLTVATTLENTGVMAYDGAVNMIQSAGLKTAAATIATVEARHAAYFNLLTGNSPFPAAFDTATSMADILKAAGGFITACPAT